MIQIGDRIDKIHSYDYGIIRRITDKTYYIDIYNKDNKKISHTGYDKSYIENGIAKGYYIPIPKVYQSVSLYPHTINSQYGTLSNEVLSLNQDCQHNWTELTLFTNSIIYCKNCNIEKKES